MLDRAIDAVDRLDRDDRVEKFLAVVIGRCRFDAGIGLLRGRIAADLATGIEQRFDERVEKISACVRVDEQALRRAADAGAPHLGIDDERHGDLHVRALIDVGMADAFEVREHRNARFLLHALHEAPCLRAER